MLWWLLACSASWAQTLTLAHTYRPDLPLHAYWVSEKYDGVRAYWNGHSLLSRQGQPIDAPTWFTQGWPKQALDGELWAGRGQFSAVQSTVALGAKDAAGWRALRYMVFDMPHAPGDFIQRQTLLRQSLAASPSPWIQQVAHWQVDSHPALMQQLHTLTQAGAEGLMLRHAHSPYRPGRSDDLIKLKTSADAEAVVIAHLPGKGKYQGLTGALLVEGSSGQRFKIGSGLSDEERAHPPPIGSTITYRYNGLTRNGLPRFARYWRQYSEPPSAQPVP